MARTAQHLRCEPEDLVSRLEAGRLWFLLDLVERARGDLEAAMEGLDPDEPVPVREVRRAEGLLRRAIRVVGGLGNGW